MSDGNATEMVMILDRSGSMGGLESDTIGGFNAMVEKQKKEEGKAYLTTILFNGNSEMLHDRLEIREVPPMTEKEYRVGGCTALVDAIGDAVHHIEKVHHYLRPEDVPARVVFIITTDGLENASHKYSAEEVRHLIRDKKEMGWEFLFLGANIDAVETARSYGIDASHAADFRNDSEGIKLNYETLSDAVASFRCAAPTAKCFDDGAWSKAIDEDYKKRGRKKRR